MDTRDKILETATRLFSNHGYRSTSLSQVAREAKVSKALIFWHFQNKEKLFRSALHRWLEPYAINTRALEGLDEVAQVKKLVDDYYEFVSENVYSARFLLSLFLREEDQSGEILGHVSGLYHFYRGLLTDVLRRGRERGVFRASVEPVADAALIMTALNGIFLHHFVRGENAAAEQEALVRQLKSSLVERLVV